MNENSISFVVSGDPFGKERPRAARKGRILTTYTPKKTVNYEKRVRSCYLKEHEDKFLEGAVEADITAYHAIPKSASKKKKEKMNNNEIPCTVKPDADNIAKCILDPLNALAFSDDNHVCKLVVEKKYSNEPRVEVELKEYVPWVSPIDVFILQWV